MLLKTQRQVSSELAEASDELHVRKEMALSLFLLRNFAASWVGAELALACFTRFRSSLIDRRSEWGLLLFHPGCLILKAVRPFDQ